MGNNKGSGIDAREMSNAPRAGNGMADAVKDAIIADMVVEQAKTVKSITAVSDLFGVPSFRLPDREGVYQNDRRPGVVSRKMAHVTVGVGAGLQLETTIYAEEKVVKDQAGNYMEQSFSVSLPRGLSAPKEDPSAQRSLSLWKQSVLDAYSTWVEKLDQSMPVTAAQSSGPRLVKRIAIAAT